MINEYEPHVPEWGVFVEDVSRYCSEDLLQKCGGGVYQVWVFELNSATYICSFTPMAWCHFIGIEAKELPEGEDAREALYDELNADTPDADYFDLKMVTKHAETAMKLEPHDAICDTREEKEEALEDLVEYCRCNGVAGNAVDHYLAQRAKHTS